MFVSGIFGTGEVCYQSLEWGVNIWGRGVLLSLFCNMFVLAALVSVFSCDEMDVF